MITAEDVDYDEVVQEICEPLDESFSLKNITIDMIQKENTDVLRLVLSIIEAEISNRLEVDTNGSKKTKR